jgi:hypothetical protein
VLHLSPARTRGSHVVVTVAKRTFAMKMGWTPSIER